MTKAENYVVKEMRLTAILYFVFALTWGWIGYQSLSVFDGVNLLIFVPVLVLIVAQIIYLKSLNVPKVDRHLITGNVYIKVFIVVSVVAFVIAITIITFTDFLGRSGYVISPILQFSIMGIYLLGYASAIQHHAKTRDAIR
jgi:heme/copper-type cytochrome/quinol oxidase subunit 2